MPGSPMRPVGEWLGASFGRLRENWLTHCALAVFGFCVIAAGVLAVYGLGIGALAFAQGWDTLKRNLGDPTRLGYMMEESRGALTLLNLLACFIGLRLYAWTFKAAVHASIDPSAGFGAALRRGNERALPFLGVLIVQQIVVGAGMVLLIVPGLILAVRLGFAPLACARDGSGVFGSFGDSARAVQGRFFGVLGRMILAGLIGGAMMVVPIVGWLVGHAWVLTAWGCLFDELTAPPRQPAAARVPGRVTVTRGPGRVAA